MVMFSSVLEWKHPLAEAEFNGGAHFSSFRPVVLLLGKFGPKSWKCQFELKFGTYTNSSM